MDMNAVKLIVLNKTINIIDTRCTMDIKQLNTFLTIARLNSFTQAAQELNYAQSTVTTQIQLLEKEFGTKLFDRLGHTIVLTHTGKRLLSYAEKIIKLSDEAKNIMNESDLPIGALAIGAVESLCIMRLPRILKEYRLRYPDVEVTLKFGDYSDFFRMLRNNSIDIALFLEKEILEEDLITVKKVTEPMVLLSSPDNLLARKDSVEPKDLNNENFILTEPGCGYRALFENMISEYSIKTRSIIETGNVQAIKQLAMSGMGITLLPQIAVEEECLQKRLVKLNWEGPKLEMLTQVMYHKNKWISGPLKVFIELIHEMGL